MSDIEKCFKDLEEYIVEVEIQYLDSHLHTIEQPDDYKYDIKTYCILCHAAFEEFIESVCICILKEIYDNFVNNQRISFSTMCLLHFMTNTSELNDTTWPNNQMLFDYFKNNIQKIKSDLSTFIIKNNHGINLKYLKKLLLPLGLNIPQDVILQNSLSQLANCRGGFAHTSNRSSKRLSPEDAKKYVDDVFAMMKNIALKARHIHYYSIH